MFMYKLLFDSLHNIFNWNCHLPITIIFRKVLATLFYFLIISRFYIFFNSWKHVRKPREPLSVHIVKVSSQVYVCGW